MRSTHSQTKSRTSAGEAIFTKLRDSELYRDYADAFRKAVGLPIELHLPAQKKILRPKYESSAPFCALIARTNRSCASCLNLQAKLEEKAGFAPKTLKCFAGLCETAVPVRVGGNLIAFLHTGHILVGERGRFDKIASTLLEWGRQVDLRRMEEAYYATRLFSRSQYESVIRLLEVFSHHLASCGEILPFAPENQEPIAVGRARRIIEESSEENLTLSHVAQVVNVSAGYFCEMFKKATGLTFIDYLSKVRVEKAKNLLQNPNLRISEIAFEVGFQSLSQFNRAFKKITDTNPTEYREKFSGLTQRRKDGKEILNEESRKAEKIAQI